MLARPTLPANPVKFLAVVRAASRIAEAADARRSMGRFAAVVWLLWAGVLTSAGAVDVALGSAPWQDLVWLFVMLAAVGATFPPLVWVGACMVGAEQCKMSFGQWVMSTGENSDPNETHEHVPQRHGSNQEQH
jgi:hypothetical protein